MKAKQKKEAIQIFELDQQEVNECFGSYLKSKGAVIADEAEFTFDVKMGAVSRHIESIKISTRLVEEEEGFSGALSESSIAGKPLQKALTLVKP